MRLIRAGLLAGGLVTTTACTTLEHGTVTKTVDVRDVKVALGSKDGVEPGDRVAFYRQDCHEEPPFGIVPEDFDHEWDVCDDVKIGNGTITEVLDKHASLVAVDPGVNVGFGALVQVQEGRAAEAAREAH